MHLIVATHGFKTSTEKLLQWFRVRYHNNKWAKPYGLVIRRVEFYDFVFKEEIKDEIIGDLMYFSNPLPVQKATSLFAKIAGFFTGRKIEMVDQTKYKKSEIDKTIFRTEEGQLWRCYAYPLAVISDEKDPNEKTELV